jgi:benzoyl-CoA reductase/2-hydroxyglutaryl-CoA dehydratase subunit BcrC/BadD/HgdB
MTPPAAVLKNKPVPDELLAIPPEVREPFLATGGLTFRDGHTVGAEEIWDYITRVGPRRHPNLYSIGRLFGPSGDVWLLSGLKRLYLTSTLVDRLNQAVADGVPVVFIQGGQGHEPYYAAGAIPSRPAHVSSWALNLKEGQSYAEANLNRQQIREKSAQQLTVDACQTAGYGIIQAGQVPVTMIAPYLANRCSDIAYGVEAHRHGPVKLPLGLVDVPVNEQADKPWAVEYTAQNLRRLVAAIAAKSGKAVTDQDLWDEYKLHNRKRRLVREYAKVWWEAKVPPTNSQDHTAILGLGNESDADPVASLQVLEESLREVRQRVAQGVRGFGLAEDPTRLFICGSCINPNLRHTDQAGGVVVGKDDGFSEVFNDVPESGDDPYRALAQTVLNYPYEQPTEKRAQWTVEQVRASRADGLIFMHQWGCNFQSSVARLIVDIVAKETGKPTAIIERSFAENPQGHEQLNTRIETFLDIARDSR